MSRRRRKRKRSLPWPQNVPLEDRLAELARALGSGEREVARYLATVSARRQFFIVGTHRTGQHGLGRLTIAPGELALTSIPIERRLVTHADTKVRVVKARLAPPWWRWGLVLSGDGLSYGVALGPRQVARVRTALVDAGFAPLDETRRVARFRPSNDL